MIDALTDFCSEIFVAVVTLNIHDKVGWCEMEKNYRKSQPTAKNKSSTKNIPTVKMKTVGTVSE